MLKVVATPEKIMIISDSPSLHSAPLLPSSSSSSPCGSSLHSSLGEVPLFSPASSATLK